MQSSKHTLASRIRNYSIAAASATAASMTSTAEAGLVFLDLSGAPVTSSGSVETFVDILGFTRGATAISISVATNSFSAANPLAPNSEFMIRGSGAATQVRGNNGAVFGYYIQAGYDYLENVGTVGVFAANFNGTTNLSMYFDGYGGPFPVGVPGVAHFKFTNTLDGQTYDGWLNLTTRGTAGNRLVELTGITVDTLDAVPEPSAGMALLCAGAAGIAAYRRRRTQTV